ncbi:hypothetical protein ABEF95_008764 [Exophiala dermatitidis]
MPPRLGNPPPKPMTATKPSTASGNPSAVPEADIATNEALLFHAEASRLAKSWLQGATGAADPKEEDNDDDEADLQRERELFGSNNAAQYSETGGVGFEVPSEPQNGGGSATSSSRTGYDQTTAFLRKQLLRGRGNASSHASVKPRPQLPQAKQRRANNSDDEDEEEGRSALGKGRSKNNKNNKTQIKGNSELKNSELRQKEITVPAADESVTTSHEDMNKGTTTSTPQSTTSATTTANTTQSRPTTNKKRGSSYLDEVLASRAAKKNKKMKQNQKQNQN